MCHGRSQAALRVWSTNNQVSSHTWGGCCFSTSFFQRSAGDLCGDFGGAQSRCYICRVSCKRAPPGNQQPRQDRKSVAHVSGRHGRDLCGDFGEAQRQCSLCRVSCKRAPPGNRQRRHSQPAVLFLFQSGLKQLEALFPSRHAVRFRHSAVMRIEIRVGSLDRRIGCCWLREGDYASW